MQKVKKIFSLCIFIALGSAISLTALAAEKKGDVGVAQYVKLNPLLLPIIDDNGVQQVVSMVVAIEVDGDNAERVKQVTPRLTDAYIQDMYGILNRHAALKNGIIQVQMIKQRLNEITDEVLGHDIETEVLLQMIQQRPI
ncbi:MAG: hypothetical protein ACLFP8_05030 [Alphaproteobacteria bacterium]